jgi:hypothetical protein
LSVNYGRNGFIKWTPAQEEIGRDEAGGRVGQPRRHVRVRGVEPRVAAGSGADRGGDPDGHARPHQPVQRRVRRPQMVRPNIF